MCVCVSRENQTADEFPSDWVGVSQLDMLHHCQVTAECVMTRHLCLVDESLMWENNSSTIPYNTYNSGRDNMLLPCGVNEIAIEMAKCDTSSIVLAFVGV